MDRIGVSWASFCECGKETSGSIKCEGILWLTKDLLASQEGIFTVDLAS